LGLDGASPGDRCARGSPGGPEMEISRFQGGANRCGARAIQLDRDVPEPGHQRRASELNGGGTVRSQVIEGSRGGVGRPSPGSWQGAGPSSAQAIRCALMPGRPSRHASPVGASLSPAERHLARLGGDGVPPPWVPSGLSRTGGAKVPVNASAFFPDPEPLGRACDGFRACGTSQEPLPSPGVSLPASSLGVARVQQHPNPPSRETVCARPGNPPYGMTNVAGDSLP
jgi:hypothetical protein